MTNSEFESAGSTERSKFLRSLTPTELCDFCFRFRAATDKGMVGWIAIAMSLRDHVLRHEAGYEFMRPLVDTHAAMVADFEPDFCGHGMPPGLELE